MWNVNTLELLIEYFFFGVLFLQGLLALSYTAMAVTESLFSLSVVCYNSRVSTEAPNISVGTFCSRQHNALSMTYWSLPFAIFTAALIYSMSSFEKDRNKMVTGEDLKESDKRFAQIMSSVDHLKDDASSDTLDDQSSYSDSARESLMARSEKALAPVGKKTKLALAGVFMVLQFCILVISIFSNPHPIKQNYFSCEIVNTSYSCAGPPSINFFSVYALTSSGLSLLFYSVGVILVYIKESTLGKISQNFFHYFYEA